MGIPISSRAISPSNSAVACASFGDAKQPLALKNNQDFSKSDI
jgi:hypothetical protein